MQIASRTEQLFRADDKMQIREVADGTPGAANI
jgi:hypothetical protein